MPAGRAPAPYGLVIISAEKSAVLEPKYFQSASDCHPPPTSPPLLPVGGIMAFLALNELLPLAIEHAGRQAAVAALFVGMALMSGNLFLLHNYLMVADHGHGEEGHHHHQH